MSPTLKTTLRALAALTLVSFAACDDVEEDGHGHGEEDDGNGHNDQEVINTVVLAFTPEDGGDTIEVRWNDELADGNPTIDDITLDDGGSYELEVSFLNELEDPAEDVTEEIEDEQDEHQVFFTGTALDDGLLMHEYEDMDSQGRPVGLHNHITVLATGDGELTVTLRHLGRENDEETKEDDLADQVATSGFGSIGGATDVQVTFPVTVQ